MSSSVFGNAVTAATLRAMPEYEGKNSITQQDRAKVALEMVNSEGKAVEARNLLEKLQFRFGNEAVTTKCLIYNATGDNMTFVIARDWNGRLCEAAYPVIVANGQWGALLHGNYCNEDESSKAGIVFSAFNNQGTEQHWFIGFSNSISGPNNHVYAEIREPGHYEKKGNVWEFLDEKLSTGKLVYQANETGGYMSVSIGNTSKPIFEAIMTLPVISHVLYVFIGIFLVVFVVYFGSLVHI